MIIKTDKTGKELESWPTIEEAAKAIKVAPAVLKKHLKGKPPKLGGFVFKEKQSELMKQAAKDIEFLPQREPISKELFNTELKTEIPYAPSPDQFDGEKNYHFTADEAGLFRQEWVTKEGLEMVGVKESPVQLDEFGDPIIPGRARGHTGLPAEAAEGLIDPSEMVTVPISEYRDHVTASAEQISDWLRTPLERRLKQIEDDKNL
jgi:hypothetical protein